MYLAVVDLWTEEANLLVLVTMANIELPLTFAGRYDWAGRF